MNEQPTAEECEFLGDEAAGAGQLEEALDHYSQARRLRCEALTMALVGDDLDSQSMSAYGTDSARLNQKIRAIVDELNPPKTQSERIADLRVELDEQLSTGRLDLASHLSTQLGSAFEELGDQDEAESAYRQAVVLARQYDRDE